MISPMSSGGVSSSVFLTQPATWAMGYLYPAYVAITANAASPNAAKLFVSYLLEEGVKAWTKDLGNFATNPTIPSHPDDPLGGTEAWAKVTMPLNAQTTVKYYGEIFDFWMKHAK
jgi:ABC-type Fe3+ transport system substrate-binding protein